MSLVKCLAYVPNSTSASKKGKIKRTLYHFCFLFLKTFKTNLLMMKLICLKKLFYLNIKPDVTLSIIY